MPYRFNVLFAYKMSKGKYVGMVLSNPHKAFDTVDHVILCDKLKHMGVGCTDWFKSYLNNRQQIFMVDGVNSELVGHRP